MTNSPGSEGERDIQEISNSYGGILFVDIGLGGSKHAREIFRVSTTPPPCSYPA